jgi:hypothetical protein
MRSLNLHCQMVLEITRTAMFAQFDRAQRIVGRIPSQSSQRFLGSAKIRLGYNHRVGRFPQLLRTTSLRRTSVLYRAMRRTKSSGRVMRYSIG